MPSTHPASTSSSTIAGLIAAVGILTNSQILVVGAMVVGPEYNAIMGVALGIDKRTMRPVIRGLLALLAGFSAAMIVTLLLALAIRWSGHTPKLYSLGVRPVSSLIDSPNLFSIIVAVLAGIVGVVSLTEARASALIGVFISVTTIPAAADVGLSVGYGKLERGSGVGIPAAPQRDSADCHGRAGPTHPADHLGRPRTGRTTAECAGPG